MTDLLEIRTLLMGANGPDSDLPLLLAQLPEADAHLVRLCAIPHVFDATIITILDPTLDRMAADDAMERLTALPLVGEVDGRLHLHDRARDYLFSQWLQEGNPKFEEVNLALHDFFLQDVEKKTESEAEFSHRQALFHLIGAEQAVGFIYLNTLFRHRYDQLRYSDCQALLNFAAEYEPILTEKNRLSLKLMEGLVADGMGRNELARRTLLEVADKATGLDQIEALRTLSRLQRGINQTSRAAAHLRRAFAAVHDKPEFALVKARLMLEEALLAQDMGRTGAGERKLREAAIAAKRLGALDDFASAENALGNLLRRRGEARNAVKHYQSALTALGRTINPAKCARIYSNLGVALADAAEWSLSETYYRKSLSIARRGQDIAGQARVLNNMARLFLRQRRTEEAASAYREAESIFMRLGDYKASGIALANLARTLRPGDFDEAVATMILAESRFADAKLEARATALRSERQKWRREDTKQDIVSLLSGLLLILLLGSFIVYIFQAFILKVP